jgi:hypothetical protein
LFAFAAAALADEMKLDTAKVDQAFRACLILEAQNGTYKSSDSSSPFALMTTCLQAAKAWVDQCVAGGKDDADCHGRALATAEATLKFLGK